MTFGHFYVDFSLWVCIIMYEMTIGHLYCGGFNEEICSLCG